MRRQQIGSCGARPWTLDQVAVAYHGAGQAEACINNFWTIENVRRQILAGPQNGVDRVGFRAPATLRSWCHTVVRGGLSDHGAPRGCGVNGHEWLRSEAKH